MNKSRNNWLALVAAIGSGLVTYFFGAVYTWSATWWIYPLTFVIGFVFLWGGLIGKSDQAKANRSTIEANERKRD